MDATQTLPSSLRDQRWRRSYEKLQDYVSAHGDAHVPYPWAQDPALANWVRNQRALRRRGALPEARIADLDLLDFAWNGERAKESHGKDRWERQFAGLERFNRAHGHSDVPHRWPQDPSLGAWVRRQRLLRASGGLDPSRIRRLNGLGFEWVGGEAKEDAEDRRWDATLARLTAWRSGHSGAIPTARGKEGTLARWLGRQKRARDVGTLSPRRLRLLRQAGLLPAPTPPRARRD